MKKGPEQPSRNWLALLGQMEVGVCIGLLILLAACHFELLIHAGGLWRDEVHSANTAAMPSVGRLWHSLWYESFPVFSLLVFRVWISLFHSGSDFSLRILGMIIGLSLCGIMVFNLRRTSRSVPLFALTLLCLNEITIRYGDSIRGYGLGCLLMLMAFYCFWRTSVAATPRVVMLTLLVSLLAAHTLYQNSFFIAGMCAGGTLLNLRASNWRRIGVIIGIGLITAVSMLVYLPGMARQQTIKMLSQADLNWGTIWRALSETLSGGGNLAFLCWKILPLLAVAAAVALLLRSRKDRPAPAGGNLLLYSLVTTVISTAGFVCFLLILKFPTQCWYYLLPLTLIAFFVDIVSVEIVSTAKMRAARLALVVVVGISALPTVWPLIKQSQTNLDGLARYLTQKASPQDTILVIPWYYGITFQRYYAGKARWSSVPKMEDLSLTRYDLLKQKMMDAEAIGPLLREIRQTLESGHRIWIVGVPEFLPAGKIPPALRPAPAFDWGWNCQPYLSAWSQNVAFFLQQHVLRAQVVPVPGKANANRYENVPLILMDGWR